MYNAENEQAVEHGLNDAAEELDARCPSVLCTFRSRLAEFVPFSLTRKHYGGCSTAPTPSSRSTLSCERPCVKEGPPNDEAGLSVSFPQSETLKLTCDVLSLGAECWFS